MENQDNKGAINFRGASTVSGVVGNSIINQGELDAINARRAFTAEHGADIHCGYSATFHGGVNASSITVSVHQIATFNGNDKVSIEKLNLGLGARVVLKGSPSVNINIINTYTDGDDIGRIILDGADSSLNMQSSTMMLHINDEADVREGGQSFTLFEMSNGANFDPNTIPTMEITNTNPHNSWTQNGLNLVGTLDDMQNDFDAALGGDSPADFG